MSGRTLLVIFGLLFFVAPTAGGLQAQTVVTTKPVAEINGDTVSMEEIDKAIAAPLGKLQEQIYNLRRQRLDGVIRDRLFAQEAAKRGVSVQSLLDAEVTAKVGLVSEEEIDRFFQANRARIKVDVDQAEVREQIRGQLQGQKIAAQREAFLQSLRKTAKLLITLETASVGGARDGVPLRHGDERLSERHDLTRGIGRSCLSDRRVRHAVCGNAEDDENYDRPRSTEPHRGLLVSEDPSNRRSGSRSLFGSPAIRSPYS